jgi:hypothetical protein
MEKPRTEPESDRRQPTPFERFVAAIAKVPKAEVDAVVAEEATQPRRKRRPKPKPAA